MNTRKLMVCCGVLEKGGLQVDWWTMVVDHGDTPKQ